MTFLGDVLIGIFLAAATTALVSKRLRPRAGILAGVSLLVFVVYLTHGPKVAPAPAPTTSLTK